MDCNEQDLRKKTSSLVIAASGTYDDSLALQMVDRWESKVAMPRWLDVANVARRGIIISNDKFADYVAKAPNVGDEATAAGRDTVANRARWIQEHCVKFAFAPPLASGEPDGSAFMPDTDLPSRGVDPMRREAVSMFFEPPRE
eukprot:SAG31_NODE_8322_length_1475_cov_0.983285_2_plen_143_part_00